MKTLTYGTLPSHAELLAATTFCRNCPFQFSAGETDARMLERTGIAFGNNLSQEQLIEVLEQLAYSDDSEANDLASCILSVLGWEWV